MKKILYLLPVIFLASCSPQFSEGGWLIPVITGSGAAYSWYRFIKTRYKAPFIVAVVLTLSLITFLIAMALDI